jgi:general stress protein 26
MGDLKNLSNEEGLKKVKELVNDINICMFCTRSQSLLFETRPMATQQVDDEGNFWFFSMKSSDKDFDIRKDDSVQLLYSKTQDSHYLSIYGKASVVNDRAKVDELWNKMAEAWFKDGKDDPELELIKVTPSDIYYWDTKNGRMVSLLKIAVSAVSGKQMDDGIQGKIKV